MENERKLMTTAERIDIAPAESWQALGLAFYALHDTLVALGVIPRDAVAETLSRFKADDPKLAAHVDSIVGELRAMPFRPMTLRDTLRVIDGDGEAE